jgi:putative transposase
MVSKKLRLLTRVGYDRVMPTRQPDPTDLSDQEWALINHRVPEARPGGRPETYPRREMLNAIFYLLRRGGSWRMVYHDVRTWCQDGTWQIMYDRRHGEVRVAAGQPRPPSAGIVDSPSVKTTATGGPTATRRTNTSTATHGIAASAR